MANKFLDKDGVTTLVQKIDERLETAVTAVEEVLDTKVDKAWGIDNADKRLCLDTEGNVYAADELPLASKDVYGIVKSDALYNIVRTYHTACPIVEGVPYYERHVINSGNITLNGGSIKNGASYYSDSTADTVTISIPLGDEQPYRRVYNIYIQHMQNVAQSNAPTGFSWITAIPQILAYPASRYYSWVNKSITSSGAAVLTDGKFEVTGHSATINGLNQYVMDIVITGITGWQDTLNYILVVD